MTQRIWRPLLILLLALIPAQALAQASAGFVVEVSDEAAVGRTVSLRMRLIDRASGREVGGLSERDIVILQDGVELKNAGLTLEALSTDALHATGHTVPFNSKQNLVASGATVGIVADLSTALNRGAPPGADYVHEIRAAAELWIRQGDAVAPGDPEAVGLFLPLATNAQPLQPASAPGFSRDHNLVIAALRAEPARAGATDLYAAILAAIEATAAEAGRRGTPAYVVVFSDGTISNATVDSSPAVLGKAEASGATLIAVGIGNPASLEKASNRLPHLAPATGGAYIQEHDPARRAERLKAAYAAAIKPVNRTGYSLAFTHTAPRDDKTHTFQVRVTHAGQEWTSQSLDIGCGAGCGGAGGADALPAMLRWYLIRALPLAMILAALATLITTLGRRQSGLESNGAHDRTRS